MRRRRVGFMSSTCNEESCHVEGSPLCRAASPEQQQPMAYALIVLQLCLAAMNIRGERKNSTVQAAKAVS